LPAAPTNALPNLFTLSFNEDMRADTVNDPANYELRGRGPDEAWDTGDDTQYSVGLWSVYGSGLSASYSLPDGPMPPDVYRFTAFATLADRFDNPMAGDYVHEFTLLGV